MSDEVDYTGSYLPKFMRKASQKLLLEAVELAREIFDERGSLRCEWAILVEEHRRWRRKRFFSRRNLRVDYALLHSCKRSVAIITVNSVDLHTSKIVEHALCSFAHFSN